MQFDADAERAFCAAAMCHDLGHTAYSHVLEKVLLPDGIVRHEDCSIRLLQEDVDLRNAVETYSKDLDAVLLFIDRERRHPNIALSTLISGPFDVDRADYLLRDSQAAGVHYGRYDLSWLLHSALIGVNKQHQPILMLDGPRGMDALRQFITGRHYMYRNIYLHPTIRSAQLLLSKIFQRVSESVDMGAKPDSRLIELAPRGLRGLLSSGRISVEDFKTTTDVEVDYLIRLASEESSDEILKTLCCAFISRDFPKCALDSGKLHESLERSHGIVEVLPAQLPLLGDGVRSESDVLEECRNVIASALRTDRRNPDLSSYLVYYERYFEKKPSLRDIRLRFGSETVHFREVQNREAGYNPFRLTESFQIYRLFAPRQYHHLLKPILAKRTQRNG